MKKPTFKEFWKAYPPRWNEKIGKYRKSDRKGALKEWNKLSDEDKILAVASAKKEKRGKYVPDARKWLYHELWNDEIIEDEPIQRQKQEHIEVVTKEEKEQIRKKFGGWRLNRKE